jgi:hypothetical protein
VIQVSKETVQRRFGPERWVTLRETGEHVQVEAWSTIASAYRVRSRRRGVFLAADRDLDEVVVHPDAERGRYWNRCQAASCGAPLTPGLPICARCKALTCSCGRCACATSARATGAKKKTKMVKKAAVK